MKNEVEVCFNAQFPDGMPFKAFVTHVIQKFGRYKVKDIHSVNVLLSSGNRVIIRDDGFVVFLPNGETKSCSWKDFFAVNRAIRIVTGGK